jgi:hydrogenase/urease accessory protein HupE
VKHLALAALACVLALLAPAAPAHEMSMAEMDLRETAPGQFIWQWATSSDKRPVSQDLTPNWPAGCEADASMVRCGSDGLAGAFAIDGVGSRYSAAIIRIFWLDGQSRVYTLTASQPKLQLFGSADDKRSWTEIAGAYGLLGIEHILSGYDHLLFVIALLFLVGFRRKLVWTITAFTAAHSLTLASAALGLLTLRSPPVEASIALSIVLVASEALQQRMTFARRWPAAIAFLFGLVHGLGFAGALKEVGLPQQHLPAALLAFNGGVEVGQLMTVGVAWLVWLGMKRLPVAAEFRSPALYGIGAIAAWWSWGRVADIIGSAGI